MRALVVVIALVGTARADDFADALAAHDRGDWPAVIRASSAFVEAHPANPNAVSAGRFWVDALTHTGALPDDYERVADKLALVPGFAAPEPHTWLLLVRRSIATGRARIAEEAQRPDLAGEAYMGLAQDPAQEDRDVAYYNAGVMFEEAHDLQRARPMYEAVAKLPRSPLAQKALFRLASFLRFVDPSASVAVLVRVQALPCPGPCVGGDNMLLSDPAQQSYLEATNLARDALVTTSYTIDAQDALARIDGSYPPRDEHRAAFIATAPIVVVGP